MHHRLFTRFAASLVLCLAASAAVALDEAPDTMIKRLSDDVVGLAKDTAIASGDASKIMDLVDTKVMRFNDTHTALKWVWPRTKR